MPSWTAVVRLLRRRLVLGVIFAVSLTYCALSLFQHEKKGALIQSDADDDQLYYPTGKPFLWQMQVLNEDEGEGDEDNSQLNSSHPLKNTCRNSIQGKALIVDERGLVCTRGEVLPSGCCSEEMITKIEESETSNEAETITQTSVKRERYCCQTCNPEGCCAVYEYCVSCCLRPAKQVDGKRLSDEPESKPAPKRADNNGGGDANGMRHRFRTLDRFQICLATCRTSSASVRHENTYKDPHSKHCYNLINQNGNHNQRYRRDLNHVLTINNNNGQPQAVLAPFSTVLVYFPPSTYSIRSIYTSFHAISTIIFIFS